MTPLTYEALIQRLFPRFTGGVRWGLERTERLLASVGDPHLAYPVLHVGGTNGKGSVAAYLEAALRASGLRTGLYTSPHLCTFRERVRVDGAAVASTALLAAAERLWPALEAEDPSFFEATTALAFDAFAAAGAEVVVVEVGLGGRLDATNVVRPRASVITNVALDHAEYLGSTLAAVAAEKAGILKPGVPAWTAAAAPEALAVLRARAWEVGAPLTEVGGDDLEEVRTSLEGTRFRMPRTGWGDVALATPLAGAHQALNAALAVRVLDGLEEGLRPDAHALARGLASTRWPGRLQVVERAGRPWIFDVAHNPDAMATLVASLDGLSLPRPRIALVGILADKDWRAMLGLLEHAVERLVLVLPPGAPRERRWDPAAAAGEVRGTRVSVAPDLAHGLRLLDEAGEARSVLVTGSFHTVGAALALLGLAPDGVDPAMTDPPLQRSAGGA